ncbi:hypothetical protein C8R43DRAFT_193200 [Mycena crocata]|nr:hypothetical protein C8R43DRAFT_193200 [Mycena crocata]
MISGPSASRDVGSSSSCCANEKIAKKGPLHTLPQATHPSTCLHFRGSIIASGRQYRAAILASREDASTSDLFLFWRPHTSEKQLSGATAITAGPILLPPSCCGLTLREKAHFFRPGKLLFVSYVTPLVAEVPPSFSSATFGLSGHSFGTGIARWGLVDGESSGAFSTGENEEFIRDFRIDIRGSHSSNHANTRPDHPDTPTRRFCGAITASGTQDTPRFRFTGRKLDASCASSKCQ